MAQTPAFCSSVLEQSASAGRFDFLPLGGICIPTPASYVVRKLYINPERRPERKRAQDIRKVDVLLHAMADVPGQLDEIEDLINRMPDEKAVRVREVAASNGITLPEA